MADQADPAATAAASAAQVGGQPAGPQGSRRLVVAGNRRRFVFRGTAGAVGQRFQIADQRALLGQQAVGFVVFVLQSLPLRLFLAGVFTHKLMPLDRSCGRPEQRPDRGRRDAQVIIGTHLEKPAGAKSCVAAFPSTMIGSSVPPVRNAWASSNASSSGGSCVSNTNSNDSSRRRAMPAAAPTACSNRQSQAPSAAKASASQLPDRCGPATCSTRIRARGQARRQASGATSRQFQIRQWP